jgi:hypothetical protein
MKTILFCTILFALFMSGLDAQDIIIKKNGEEIQSKILEVSGSEIKYKKFDNVDGPSYTIDKSEVFVIKYADGTKAVINRMDVAETAEEKKTKANEHRIFQERKSYITAGYGFGIFFGWQGLNDNGYEGFSSSLTGPVYGKYEYGVTEDFGIGINLAYLEYKYSYLYNSWNSGSPVKYTEADTYTSFSALLRANWHFGNNDKVDPYFGFGLGYRSATVKYTNNDPGAPGAYQGNYINFGGIWGNGNNAFPFGFETTFGIRVKFSEHISAYTEAGIAKSVVQFGLTSRF